jgi:phage replication O-like protein O
VSRQLIPNSTQIPDVILDKWMAELSGAEFKVLLYVARRTYGFGKVSDRISLSQIADGITKRDGTVLDRGTGISRSSVARALNSLIELGIVLRKTNLDEVGREFEESTYSINLNWPSDSSRNGGGDLNAPGGGQGEEGVVPNSGNPPSKKRPSDKRKKVVPKSDYVVSKSDDVAPNSARGWSDFEAGVVPKSDIQETDQETVQETASSSEAGSGGDTNKADAAFLDLVKELTENGVGHAVAQELARNDPKACRLCLEYLPFAEIKKSKGAFLANAIRDGYGPPKGYEEAKRQSATKDRSENLARSRHPIEYARIGDLRTKYEAMQHSEPVRFASYLNFKETEKRRIQKIVCHLSRDRGSEILAEWESEQGQLELFKRWLRSSLI